jgi:biopolymer transport protein ExbD
VKIKRIDQTPAPEINLIPLIDILLVIVIFLVVSSTFIRQSQLRVELPGTQNGKTEQKQDNVLRIRIGKDGNYALGNQGLLNEQSLRIELTKTLSTLPEDNEHKAIIEADAMATHQSVVTVMDILASLGVARVSIATTGGK